MDLFDIGQENSHTRKGPLAYRMRPRNLDEVIGQEHLIGPGAPLRRLIERDELHSFVLYGPPGTGKTTIARIIAETTHHYFETLMAVSSGVNDIRKIAADAVQRYKYYQQRTYFVCRRNSTVLTKASRTYSCLIQRTVPFS